MICISRCQDAAVAKPTSAAIRSTGRSLVSRRWRARCTRCWISQRPGLVPVSTWKRRAKVRGPIRACAASSRRASGRSRCSRAQARVARCRWRPRGAWAGRCTGPGCPRARAARRTAGRPGWRRRCRGRPVPGAGTRRSRTRTRARHRRSSPASQDADIAFRNWWRRQCRPAAVRLSPPPQRGHGHYLGLAAPRLDRAGYECHRRGAFLPCRSPCAIVGSTPAASPGRAVRDPARCEIRVAMPPSNGRSRSHVHDREH
jgi:hypothetical protein